jgi:hypothetical protein
MGERRGRGQAPPLLYTKLIAYGVLYHIQENINFLFQSGQCNTNIPTSCLDVKTESSLRERSTELLHLVMKLLVRAALKDDGAV